MAANILVVLVGPTAVGKTEVCLKLAQHYNTEILSTDSRQFFRELNIGTAKPSLDELSRVPHHFINSLSIIDSYDVKQFEQDALGRLSELFQTYRLVIATGGSGLYVKTLCEGMDDIPDVTEESRQYWNEQREQRGLEYLLGELQRVDLTYYRQVDRHNHRRIQRALEVYRSTGRPLTEFHRQRTAPSRPFTIIKVGLYRERAELYRRIDLRVDRMLAAGLEAEARELYPHRHRNALRTVGYQEWFPYFEGEYDYDEAVRLIKRNSRRYAKRQYTWFRKDPSINWFDARVPTPDLLSRLVQHIDQPINP